MDILVSLPSLNDSIFPCSRRVPCGYKPSSVNMVVGRWESQLSQCWRQLVVSNLLSSRSYSPHPEMKPPLAISNFHLSFSVLSITFHHMKIIHLPRHLRSWGSYRWWISPSLLFLTGEIDVMLGFIIFRVHALDRTTDLQAKFSFLAIICAITTKGLIVSQYSYLTVLSSHSP